MKLHYFTFPAHRNSGSSTASSTRALCYFLSRTTTSTTKNQEMSILRYPGGKSRAVSILEQYVPKDCKEICSPFLGGVSLELFLAQERKIQVYGFDLFAPLVNFWQCLRSHQTRVCDQVSEMYRSKVDKPRFFALRQELVTAFSPTLDSSSKTNNNDSVSTQSVHQNDKDKNTSQEKAAAEQTTNIRLAAIFFVLNRCSFSGTTCSGGFSLESSTHRFTESCIQRLRNVNLVNLHIGGCLDVAESIATQPKDRLLYLDPPYYLTKAKSKLYGMEGRLHIGFDHQNLFDLLRHRPNWILSYNNCDFIRTLYKDFYIADKDWSYGMSSNSKKRKRSKETKTKTSKEIIILSLDLAVRKQEEQDG